ncbi:response regulator [Arthrobacter sp. KFRI-F3372]|uniref:response regulator transcription factor n=1 Tax=Micrococcaceae TaxID=1268 RepID=UPI002788536A|nr:MULTISPECIES: response regulator [Micrococcaceae]MDP9988996.1 DNA-binding response OmpR family regulator [Arthrobacter oryzae]MEE2523896.1 response regulator [Pseudarthrobacter sp. J47]MEE2530326.1 response regulator [Pseudarthrobacter sp. J75]WHP61063.1 response regulator [Arthrobacter sp. KFRI-F3372]
MKEILVMPGARTLIVIEDDEDIGRLIQGVLGGTGLTVFLERTGVGGVSAVNHHSPAAVLLDYGLPDIDGLEVIRRIRSFSDVYILILTGHVNMSGMLMTAGADAVMTKPFRPKTLLAHIQERLALPAAQDQNLPEVGDPLP